MTSFLHDIAKELLESKKPLNRYTLVFPNRRAILYFRKHLSSLIPKPVFSPVMLTIEEFISGFSTLKIPDRLELVYRLYAAYCKVVKTEESFDRFYFWGEMLLRDFDEIDKYLVNAEHLFKDLTNLKELDARFDYLTPEHKEYLSNFWGNLKTGASENKQKFLEVWRCLGLVYTTFRSHLLETGLAYEGMLHRQVAENPIPLPVGKEKPEVIFIGFNALTRAEEKIIAHVVEHEGGKVYWDVDEYYLNTEWQEAGAFFRKYKNDPVFGKTFTADVPANFRNTKSVNVFGAAQPIGQAKLLGQLLEAHLQSGMNPEETVVVLPDEKLLLPVLHSVAGYVAKLNVTMGFPLGSTPLFNLIEWLLDMQIVRRKDHFNHRPVLALLGHPYSIAADQAAAHTKRKEILWHNWVYIPKSFLATSNDLHRLMFVEADGNSITTYLKNILLCIGSMREIGNIDKEYAYYFLKVINRMEEVLGSEYESLQAFLKLFRQLVRFQKIPFSGEPLQGMQIMGMLETRNLDFKNVFILSLNEGSLPAYETKGSYLPYSVRKAYGLPTAEHQDAIYAYLFYRSLQRAENVFLFYNTETDVLGQGEISRFLRQLIYESGLNPRQYTLSNTIQPHAIKPIVIHKDSKVMEAIARLNEGSARFRGIAPSALNTYLECRLQFYFKYILKIREADEIEEDLDARILGNLLHEIMERFYKQLAERKRSKLVEPEDFDQSVKQLDKLLDEAFIKLYHLNPDKPVDYDGQRMIVREVVTRFAQRIIEEDRKHAPFILEGTELEGLVYTLPMQVPPGRAVLGGKIDRVDRKGDLLRIVDYKTGKDEVKFSSIESLFIRDENRNKAAFQILLYTLIYTKSIGQGTEKVVPGLFGRINLFDDAFTFGLVMNEESIADAIPLLPEFEARLKIVLEELFGEDQPFDQTNEIKTCRNCPYKQICYR
ncbi:MAG: PD-(D/E)XK nuclease family protein [Cyclobacteriaceae bacterium]